LSTAALEAEKQGEEKENGGMDILSIPPFNWRIFLPACCRSDHFGDSPAPNTTGADFHGANRPVVQRFDVLKIRVPSLFGLVIRMTDIIAGGRFFPANCTNSRHDPSTS
jgi:hypothetical protein